jgi:hypothetical protein
VEFSTELDGHFSRAPHAHRDDEFDLFVSRIRNHREIDAASAQVAEFRGLAEDEKVELREEVRDRIPQGSGANPYKPYDNWRDMARHTFSLFALGESASRVGNQLFLSSSLSRERDQDEGGERRDRRRGEAASGRHRGLP